MPAFHSHRRLGNLAKTRVKNWAYWKSEILKRKCQKRLGESVKKKPKIQKFSPNLKCNDHVSYSNWFIWLIQHHRAMKGYKKHSDGSINSEFLYIHTPLLQKWASNLELGPDIYKCLIYNRQFLLVCTFYCTRKS